MVEDLTIRVVNVIAHIMQDDLENAYDPCGGGSGNHKSYPVMRTLTNHHSLKGGKDAATT